MANKKTTRKQKPKVKKASARKPAPKKTATKKVTAKKAVKKVAAPKKLVRKKVVAKKKAAKKPVSRKLPSRKITAPRKMQSLDAEGIERSVLRARAGIQSGDLQGLSRKAGSASESVDELLEEGNAFEAGIVQGIEDADESDEDEVLSHEMPVDDVPGEYLDED